MRRPRTTLVVAVLACATTAWPLAHLGGEFMPQLNEGDLLYMPSALPGISTEKASELLQQTDRLIKTVPEVASVFGKAGRAESATDPAPLEMFETTIQFKPQSQWRPGMTPEKLVDELDRTVRVPGLTNVWVPPIRNRIDMLATGIKSPIGVKVSGSDLAELDRIAHDVETTAKTVPGVSSALAERLTGGRYADVDIDRAAAARYGLNIADVQAIISGAVGGETVGQTVEGLARYPISVRYPRELRDSLEKPAGSADPSTPGGQQITLGTVARLQIAEGPPMLKTENGPAFDLGLCRRARARPGLGRRRSSEGRRQERQALPRRVGRLLGPVRIPPAGGRAAEAGRAGDPADHFHPAHYVTFGRVRPEAALIRSGTLPFALTGGILDPLLAGVSTSRSPRPLASSPWPASPPSSALVMLIYLKDALADRGEDPTDLQVEDARCAKGALPAQMCGPRP